MNAQGGEQTTPPPCLQHAWDQHRGELFAFLRHRANSPADAEDLLQEIFIKALRQRGQFCGLANPRAWLFQVARNTLADRLRVSHALLALPADLAAPESESPPAVDGLSQCLPRVLAELDNDDRLAITLCDIEGATGQRLADHLGISLAAAKSRLRRARQRLRARLETACQVRYDEDGSVIGFTPRPPLPDAGGDG